MRNEDSRGNQSFRDSRASNTWENFFAKKEPVNQEAYGSSMSKSDFARNERSFGAITDRTSHQREMTYSKYTNNDPNIGFPRASVSSSAASRDHGSYKNYASQISSTRIDDKISTFPAARVSEIRSKPLIEPPLENYAQKLAPVYAPGDVRNKSKPLNPDTSGIAPGPHGPASSYDDYKLALYKQQMERRLQKDIIPTKKITAQLGPADTGEYGAFRGQINPILGVPSIAHDRPGRVGAGTRGAMREISHEEKYTSAIAEQAKREKAKIAKAGTLIWLCITTAFFKYFSQRLSYIFLLHITFT